MSMTETISPIVGISIPIVRQINWPANANSRFGQGHMWNHRLFGLLHSLDRVTPETSEHDHPLDVKIAVFKSSCFSVDVFTSIGPKLCEIP